MSDDTKACPFCAEDIKAAAIVCKHCGGGLPGHQDTISKVHESIARELTLYISLRRIFDFKGKANRTEYGFFTFGQSVFLYLVLLFLPFDILLSDFWVSIFAVYFLISFISMISVAVRRLHALGRDGFLVFLYIVPLVNIITMLYLFYAPDRTKTEKKKRRKSGW